MSSVARRSACQKYLDELCSYSVPFFGFGDCLFLCQSTSVAQSVIVAKKKNNIVCVDSFIFSFHSRLTWRKCPGDASVLWGCPSLGSCRPEKTGNYHPNTAPKTILDSSDTKSTPKLRQFIHNRSKSEPTNVG